MKRSIARLIAVVPLTVSLVVAGGVAHADTFDCYVATTTTVMSPSEVTRGESVEVCAAVTVKSGTGTPTGSVTFGVRRIGSSATTFTTVPYSGGEACITTAELKKKGGREVTAAYSGTVGSVFADSNDVRKFKVVKKPYPH